MFRRYAPSYTVERAEEESLGFIGACTSIVAVSVLTYRYLFRLYRRKDLSCSRSLRLEPSCFRRLFELVNELIHECLPEEFVPIKSGRCARFPRVTRLRPDVTLMLRVLLLGIFPKGDCLCLDYLRIW